MGSAVTHRADARSLCSYSRFCFPGSWALRQPTAGGAHCHEEARQLPASSWRGQEHEGLGQYQEQKQRVHGKMLLQNCMLGSRLKNRKYTQCFYSMFTFGWLNVCHWAFAYNLWKQAHVKPHLLLDQVETSHVKWQKITCETSNVRCKTSKTTCEAPKPHVKCQKLHVKLQKNM